MIKAYIGIDPGQKGCITLIAGDDIKHWFYADYTIAELSDILYGIRAKYSQSHAILEDVKNLHGVGAMSTFKLGMAKGVMLGILCAARIPYTMVSPQTWQKVLFTSSDKVYKGEKKLDTKATSIKVAQRLFPQVDFRRTEKCRNIDDNFTDSILMAEYARRLNL